MSELGTIVKPAWPILKPEYISDTVGWYDREPLPADPEAKFGIDARPSTKAAVIGVFTTALLAAECKYPHLEQSLAYRDSEGNARMALLPKFLGNFSNAPAYLAVGLQLAPYATQYSIGLGAHKMPFIEAESELEDPTGQIRYFGSYDIELLRRSEPFLPIVQRLTAK